MPVKAPSGVGLGALGPPSSGAVGLGPADGCAAGTEASGVGVDVLGPYEPLLAETSNNHYAHCVMNVCIRMS